MRRFALCQSDIQEERKVPQYPYRGEQGVGQERYLLRKDRRPDTTTPPQLGRPAERIVRQNKEIIDIYEEH
jgi:hypothetical protein